MHRSTPSLFALLVVGLATLTFNCASGSNASEERSASTSAPLTAIFTASADTYVVEGNASSNYGTNPKLDIDTADNGQRYSFLKFAVSGIPDGATIKSARVELYCTGGTDNGPKIYATSSATWDESTITWNNKPTSTGAALSDLGSVTCDAGGTLQSFPVTAAVTKNGTYSFVLMPDSANDFEAFSREGSATKQPRLVIDYATASSPACDTDASSPPPPPPPPSTTGLDEDGVRMLLPTNTAGSSWKLGTKNPNTDPEFEVDGDAAATKAGDYWTAEAREGGLASGGTQLTLRLHLNVTASQGTQETNQSKMAAQGYMVSPKDLRNLELTGYFRVREIADMTEGLSMKLRGGSHTDDSPSSASCIGLIVQYDGAGTKLWEKELFHPDTPKFNVTKLASHGSVADKWIGVKALVWNVDGNTKAISELWVDSSPFDSTGKPANNWTKIYRYTDVSGPAVTWGGKFETFRFDQARFVDFKMLSVREIVPPT